LLRKRATDALPSTFQTNNKCAVAYYMIFPNSPKTNYSFNLTVISKTKTSFALL